MATKLDRKVIPSGLSQGDFKYQGRPAKDQGDFGQDVGLADMACVNQFGEANNAKYYHGGVVLGGGRWFVYLEWGRMKAAKSWDGTFGGGDYQFVECTGEHDAREFFRKQMESKNIKRLVQKQVAGVTVWAAKPDDDGYLVQDLATREKGLPDAYTIKDSSGIVKTAGMAAAAQAKASRSASARTLVAPSQNFQPQVIKLAQDLVGGVQTFARAMAAAAGVTPTMNSIKQVREQFIPAAMQRLAVVGSDIQRQVQDHDLRDISRMVNSIVPRPIPRSGWTDEQAILNGGTILGLQADLDAFEAALRNEDFSLTAPSTAVDPHKLLNADIRWIEPNSPEGAWLRATYTSMTRNRHSYMGSHPASVLNMYAVERPDRDTGFMSAVQKVAALRKGSVNLKANLQPRRTDLGGNEALYRDANVALAIHGTRAVNVAPILQGNLKLPRQLNGVTITGANFGHGIYFATDYRKSYGYTGHGSAYYGGGGSIRGRDAFMFLCDMVMGDAYRAPSTGNWTSPPNGKDSVFGVGGDRGHSLENDEHVIFDSNYQRIRYIIEMKP